MSTNEEIRLELSRLIQETARLQQRLSQLQQQIHQQQPTNEKPPAGMETPAAAPILDYSMPTVPTAEKQIGMRWMVIVGVVALVIAFAYQVRIAVQNGWINEQVRCAAAVVGGLVMFFVGGRIRQRFVGYGEVLMSGGVVAAFIGIYAAHFLYGLISGAAALGFIGAMAFATAFYSWRLQAQSPIYIGLIGAYVAPFLIKAVGTSVLHYFGYLTILNIGYLLLAVVFQLLPLQLLALYVSSAMYAWGWWQQFSQQRESWLMALLYQIGHFICFGLATILPALKYRRGLDQTQTNFLFPAVLLFYAFGSQLLLTHAEAWHLPFGILTGIFLMSLTDGGRRALQVPVAEHYPSVMMLVALGIMAFHMLIKHQQGIALTLSVVVWFYLITFLRQICKRALAMELLTVFALGYLVLRLNFEFGYVAGEMVSPFMNLQFLMLTAVGVSLVYAVQREKQKDATIGDTLPYLGHFMIMRGLYLEAERCSVGDFTAFLVTFFWIFYAVVVLLYGVWRKNDSMRQQALKLLGFCTLKVFLFDTHASSTGIKAAAYFLLGVVLTVVGYFYQKKRQKNSTN